MSLLFLCSPCSQTATCWRSWLLEACPTSVLCQSCVRISHSLFCTVGVRTSASSQLACRIWPGAAASCQEPLLRHFSVPGRPVQDSHSLADNTRLDIFHVLQGRVHSRMKRKPFSLGSRLGFLLFEHPGLIIGICFTQLREVLVEDKAKDA